MSKSIKKVININLKKPSKTEMYKTYVYNKISVYLPELVVIFS